MKNWIGIIHVPPNLPEWFDCDQSNDRIFAKKEWKNRFKWSVTTVGIQTSHEGYARNREFPNQENL